MKTELIEISAELQTTEFTKFSDVQSIDLLLEYGFKLQQYVARTGQLMSEAKEALHKERKQAYHDAELKLKKVGKDFSPMLLKDYINDCCAEANSLYELAERTNRACVHAGDLVRTAVSALKNEWNTSSYSNVVKFG